ncbi:MAG TPA: hypothetical protein VE863_04140 [Pyrinomonadaceae bacterium]|jgi:hypothetical protein|nr:hypothetical protein [Pyrinomonadaceae bacterium]
MSAQNLQLVAATTPNGKPPIRLLTDNGFTIVRSCDLNGVNSADGKHCFVVRDPNDYELEITVQIGPAAAHDVIRRSHDRIKAGSGYWEALAERHLADYLWEQGDYPPDACLVVKQLTPVDCDLALRWPEADEAMVVVKPLSLYKILITFALSFCTSCARFIATKSSR